ncbi:MAG: CCDC90 family protein [Tannerella sp.]|jgi:dsDNA-specific endonuclease/ATPase MutS2|nr:CCDC90 family protein [Tannerella sp.]
MSAEQITLISVAVTVVIAVGGGLWAMIKYLSEFRKEFREEIRILRSEMQLMRSELKEEIQSVREELKGEIQSVREELKGEIQSVREELKGEIHSVREELKSENMRLENRITHIDQKLDFIGYGYDFTQNPPKKLRTRRLVKTEE